MKKLALLIATFLIVLTLGGFTYAFKQHNSFDIEDLYSYNKKYKTEEIEVCGESTAKTYMDYRMTTVVNSTQYQFIHNNLTVDESTGFLYDDEGFIAVALGSFYGDIGDRFYFTLDSGVVLPLVKAEEKADEDTDYTGCYHLIDSSIIEFVIDTDYAENYFWSNSNGYVLNGNYNNHPLFNGEIVKVEKVLDEIAEGYVTYSYGEPEVLDFNIFNYASGY